MRNTVKFFKTRDVKDPTRGTDKSAGIDFYIPEDYVPKTSSYSHDMGKMLIKPGEDILIPSGIKAKIPSGFALIAFNKSGITTKQGLSVGACVVDEDYQGEIHIHLINHSNKSILAPSPGMKVIQFILVPTIYANIEFSDSELELFEEKTQRGEGGFGSTGIC